MTLKKMELYQKAIEEAENYTPKELETSLPPASGTIDNLKWHFSGDVLTFSGNGVIPNYEGQTPWEPFYERIKKIVLKGNITKEGILTFGACRNLKSVTFENEIDDDESYNHIGNLIDMAIHGFSKNDLYCLESWFYGQITNILREYRRVSPEFCDDEDAAEQGLDNGFGRVVDRMIYCFSQMGNEYEHTEYFELLEKFDEKTNDDEYFALLEKSEASYPHKREEHEANLEKLKEEGFELFKRHLSNLWY